MILELWMLKSFKGINRKGIIMRIYFISLLVLGTFAYGQNTCVGIVHAPGNGGEAIMTYENVFGQSFIVPSCAQYISGFDIDFTGGFSDGYAMIWEGPPDDGSNPQPVATFHFGSVLGTNGVINSWDHIDFTDGGTTKGVFVSALQTYTITISMNGQVDGVQYDSLGTFLDGVYYNFETSYGWSEVPAIDLFFKVDFLTITGTEIPEINSPQQFKLAQNYPNPFNPSTTIEYNLEKAAPVVLNVYNLNGTKVAELVHEKMSAGSHTVRFDAASGLASGIYFYVLKTGNFVERKKMMLLR